MMDTWGALWREVIDPSPWGPSWLDVAFALVAAFVAGQAIGWTYEYTYRGLSYSRGFTQSLILIMLGTVALVLAMQQSLLAGVGLFGVLSLSRFRSNLKAPRDLVFLMASVTLGVSLGVSAWSVAVLGTAMFCAVALYLHHSGLGSRRRYDGLLRFVLPAGADLGPAEALLSTHCRRFELLSAAEVHQGREVEQTFQIKLRRLSAQGALIQGLREGAGARDVRVLLQDAALEY
jgi:hypothetical protein